MTILDELRAAEENGGIFEAVDSLNNAVAFEFDAHCQRVSTGAPGKYQLLLATGRPVTDGFPIEVRRAEAMVLDEIGVGPVRVTVIVQPVAKKGPPATRADFLRFARQELDATAGPVSPAESSLSAALGYIIKALETDQ